MRETDMMLLCPTHHREAKVMPESEQRAHKREPHNRRRGFVDGQLRIATSAPVIQIGSVELICDGPVLLWQGKPFLSLAAQSGRLSLSVELLDEQLRPLATIDNNRWTAGDADAWDVEFGFQTLLIRQKARDIRLDIDASTCPITISALLWTPGGRFELRNQLLFSRTGGQPAVGFRDLALCRGSLNIDHGPTEGTLKVSLSADGMFPGDPRTRVELALQRLQGLKTSGTSEA